MNSLSKLSRLVVSALLMPAGIAFATTFNFSYTFGDGLVVSGSLDGVQNGAFVENVTGVSLLFNGTPIAGPIFTATYNGLDWVNGPVVSFDVFKNNFMFVNDDIAQGGGAYDSLFWILNSGVAENAGYAQADPLGFLSVDVPTESARWSLTVSSVSSSVPDEGSIALMLGFVLAGLARLRCR